MCVFMPACAFVFKDKSVYKRSSAHGLWFVFKRNRRRILEATTIFSESGQSMQKPKRDRERMRERKSGRSINVELGKFTFMRVYAIYMLECWQQQRTFMHKLSVYNQFKFINACSYSSYMYTCHRKCVSDERK